MKTAKAVILGLFIIIFVLFVVQNLQLLTASAPLKINLLFVSGETPPLMTAILLISCFLLGFIAAYSLSYHERRKLKKNIKLIKAHQKRTEAELSSLRNLPIVSEDSPVQPTPPAASSPLNGFGGQAR